MKKIIRFLARISGVEDDIKQEAFKSAGYEIGVLAAWFCMEHLAVQNALGIIAWQIKRCGRIYHQEAREKYHRWLGSDFCRASKEKQDDL